MSAEDNEQVMLIWNDPKTNKNKFYEVTRTGDYVKVRYGRVGEQGTTLGQGAIGVRGFERTVRQKKNKGYKEASVVTNPTASRNSNLQQAANATLLANNSDPRLAALVNRLVQVNAHEILKASGGKLQVEDGQIRTPLGLLTKEAIDQARIILTTLEKKPKDRASVLGDYMTLVPQNVGRGRGWVDTFLATKEDLDQQAEFLTQLEQSLDFAMTQQNATQASSGESYDDLFRYKILPVDEGKLIDSIRKSFMDSRNRNHGYSIYNSTLKNVYAFTDAAATAVFGAKAAEIGNVMSTWHGTRAMNLLSIASKGLKSPRELRHLYTTGAMFGQGIYSSTCSTKALGYSDTGVWSGARGNTHYLFATEVALGNVYKPGKSKPSSTSWDQILDGKVKDEKGRAYSSIDVAPGFWNLLNPETIVPNANQMVIRYLLELES